MEISIKKYATAIFAVIIFSLPTVALAGGPWTKTQGDYYVKLSEWVLQFDQHYTDTGQIDPNITTGIYNTFLYVEYGVTDRFTAIFNGNLFGRNVMNNIRSQTTNEVLVEGDALNAFGDLELGLKYSLSKPGSQVASAISLHFGLPTGATGKGEFGNLATGDGEFNQMLQFDIGRGFKLGSIPGYLSAYTSVNNRTQGFSEEFRFGGELGLQLVEDKLWLSTKFNAIRSFKNGDLSQEISSTSIFANNTEFTSIGFEANYYLNDRIGLSANYTGAVGGRIIAAAPSYSFGVFFDM